NSNVAIANATVAMQVRPQIGSKEVSVKTDSNGNYSFTTLQTGGNYSFSAYKPVITFTPQLQVYNSLSSNQTLNFTGTAATGLIGKLAYLREAATNDIVVANADGSAEAVAASVGTQCSSESGPTWSPDGAKLAFPRCNG